MTASTITPPPFPAALERYPRLRQSVLSTFDNCALQSRFDLEHRQGWSSHPAGRGQLTHRTIARSLELMEAHQEPQIPVEVTMEIFDEVMRQHDVPMAAELAQMSDEVVIVPLRQIAEARTTVRTWASYFRVEPHLIAGVERRLETIVPYPDGSGGTVERVVTGKLDLLLIDGETAIVLDWKDTWGIPSEKAGGGATIEEGGPPPGENISEEGYFQQRMYALLVFRTYPRIQRVILREFYPRYASGTVLDARNRPVSPVREATLDRYVLPEIEREISALVERFDRAIETGVHKPAPGSHCSYCPRPEACPIMPSARAEGAIATMEDAEKAAGRLQVVRSIATQTARALNAFSRARGNVAVPVRDAKRPRVYGPVVRQRTARPTADEMKDAQARGIDPASLYKAQEIVEFCFHTPDEVHPHVQAARAEEERLLAAERGERSC